VITEDWQLVSGGGEWSEDGRSERWRKALRDQIYVGVCSEEE
jgi:hypothetical protein